MNQHRHPVTEKERAETMAIASDIARETGERIAALIVMYATSKGVPPEMAIAYVDGLEPPLPNIVHGYAVTVTNLLLARLRHQAQPTTPSLLPN